VKDLSILVGVKEQSSVSSWLSLFNTPLASVALRLLGQNVLSLATPGTGNEAYGTQIG
jgi:hypothetical protein